MSPVAPDVAVEYRWLIIWPNGQIYGDHPDEASAKRGAEALISALSSYTVPAGYFPTVKRRKRTVTTTPWEDA